MWVFDGEEWKRDGEEEQKRTPEPVEIPMDLLTPQLQVVEVVQTPKTLPRTKK